MKRHAAIAIGLGTLLLVVGFLLEGRLIAATAALALGGLWSVGLRQGWHGSEALGLAGFVGMAALGVLLGLPALFPLTSVVVGLAGWDIQRFARRLEDVGSAIEAAGLARAHLWRLGLLCGLGWLLAAIALGVRVSLSFGWALPLAALAIVGLSRAIQRLNRARE